jgi:hypothetical protein
MFRIKKFKRLDIQFNSFTYHPFFLERMAYNQWNNKLPFVSGPFIQVETANDEYKYWSLAGDINESLKYFMKPHRIVVFGDSTIKNRKFPHIMSRVWLNAQPNINLCCVFMERINTNQESDRKYITAINNSSWRPVKFSDYELKKELQQEVVLTNKPYDGCFEVRIT